ncbi:TPA: hypothetical protein OT117_002676 [Acinetobacter baumannii]|nr:hypothetical protein [Acinetobacter baumannii]
MFNEDEEKLAHEIWYKNNDPIAYKFYRDLSPEFETDFYTSETAWLARAKAQAVPEGYVLMPIKPTETMVMAVVKEHEGDAFLPYSLYDAYVKQAMIEAQEQTNDK